MKIGFIGLGNMATAMIDGMLKSKLVTEDQIIGSSKTEETRQRIREQFHINVVQHNKDVAKESDVLILAVKPQIMSEVISEIKDVVSKDSLIVSIAVGKTIDYLEEAFGKDVKIVRCMPNTPIMVQAGCTGFCANESVTVDETTLIERLFGCFGQIYSVPESLMDVVAAVSGSTPAYVFMFIEAIADAAVASGMPRAQAYQFAAQTVCGSGKLALESGKHPGELKDAVCSPAGTTIEGVRVLEQNGFRGSVIEAILATIEKSSKMSGR